MGEVFWRLEPPSSGRGIVRWAEDLHEPFAELPCGHIQILRLKELTVKVGSARLTDLMWTWLSECLIQDHVLAAFRQQGFAGFQVRPAHAVRRTRGGASVSQEAPTPKLWELVVTGWGGIGRPESGVRLLEKCECGFQAYTVFHTPSLLIDESQWDGSDFFMVWPLPRFIFVTDRVAQFLRNRRLAAARLVPVAAMETWDKTAVLGLRHYMPEPRAREIGEPLGIY